MSNESKNFNIEGMSEVLKMLSDLPAHLEQEILQKYLQNASNKYVVEAIKSGLPYSMHTEKAIKVSKDKLKYLAFVSGPTTKAYWIRFVEKGTALRKTEKGANRGQLVGKFRIPSIVKSQIQPIIDEAHTDIKKEIEDFINKNNKTLK